MDAEQWIAVPRQAIFGVVLAAVLIGCGGGGSDGSVSVQTSQALKPLSLVAMADKSYGFVRGRSGSTVEVFRDAAGAPKQSLYTNADTREKVRTFNDVDGLPERVLDEVTGSALTITRTSPERLDFRAFDGGGKYIGGYAVLVRSDGLYAARVSGTPSFAGQLTGQLQGSAQTGSFALLPTADAGLGTAVQFTPAALALADSAPRLALGAHESAQALLGIDRRAVLGGLAMGLTVGAVSGPVPGLVSGAMMAFYLQHYGLPILDGVRDANSLEQLSDNLNTFLDRFDHGASASTALGDSLAGVVADRVKGAIRRAFDAATDIASAITDRAKLPALTDRAPASDTAVNGFGVDQSGTNYALAGSVAANGGLTAVATPGNGGGTILINGNVIGSSVTGTISGRLGNGTVSGRVDALGQCAALQQSGGQGTFSYAFDAGAATGSLVFYRDACTIPDGFRVISSGQTLYDTGGLVSGAETRTLALVGSRILFVTVNAPNSGTQWQLRVGCPA